MRNRASRLLLFFLLAFARPIPAEEPPGRSVHALEMSRLPADELTVALQTCRTCYTGETPEELLLLMELLLDQGRPGAEADGLDGLEGLARQIYAPCLGILVDMLYEWPTPTLAEAVLERLEAGNPHSRLAALRAACAAAQNRDVAEALLALAAEPGADTGERVMAVLALGESESAAAYEALAGLGGDSVPAVREAVAQARHSLRIAIGQGAVAAPGAVAIAAASIGKSLFGDYPSLPQVDLLEGKPTVVTVDVGHLSGAAFGPRQQGALTGVLERGGTVLAVHPAAAKWPPRFAAWARAQGVALPDQVQRVAGMGEVNYAAYRRFTDFPYGLRDQPGSAAATAWTAWGEALAAPVLAHNGSGALVLVQENCRGRGRVVLTTVDLATRPVYRENILRWVCGDSLLAHGTRPGSAYAFATTGSTPHVPWAKPGAYAKPRLLLLSRNGRGLLEIVQRLDADVTFVPYDAGSALPPGRTRKGIARMAQRAVSMLEDALPRTDVLLFEADSQIVFRGNNTWVTATPSLDCVPARLRRRIYRRVHVRGMGLLGAGAPLALEGNARDFQARCRHDNEATGDFFSCARYALPFRAFDHAQRRYSGVEMLAARRGKGRLFCWGSQSPPHLGGGHALSQDYAVPGLLEPQVRVSNSEYWYALLAKSVLWTAGRLPRTRIASLEVPQAEAGKSFAVQAALNRPADGTLSVHLRNAYNEIAATAAVRLTGQTAPIAIPALPAGWYVLECRLLDAKGLVLDFAACRVTVTGAVRVTAVAPSATFVKPGENAVLQVTLSAPARGMLVIKARDRYGRLTHAGRQALPDATAECTVAVPVRNPLSRLWDVAVSLVQDGREVSVIRQPIGIALPPPDLDFDVTAKLSDPGIAGFYRDVMGANVTYGHYELALREGFGPAADSWSDPLGAVPRESARLVPSIRQPCLSSPSFRLRALRDIREKGPLWQALGIRDYMIGDECPVGAPCYGADTLSRFRLWLRLEYASLDKLNREWGTAFARWRDVVPESGSDRKRPGSYTDFARFTHWVFCEYGSFLEMAMADYVPQFVAGHSGGISDPMAMALNGSLYYYNVNERAVSMKRPNGIVGAWFHPGYTFAEDRETEARYWPWWHLLRGTTRMQLWWPDGGGPPAYYDDLSRPFMAFVWLKEEMEDIRTGLGKLLLHVPRCEGEVAVYLSQRSQFALTGLRRQQWPQGVARGRKVAPRDRWLRAWGGLAHHTGSVFQKAVLDSQVECRFLSDWQTEAGVIAERKPKLLLLAGALCLSAAERRALRDFVQAGGVLVGDLSTALCNEHGTWVGDGFAREIFGVDLSASWIRVVDADIGQAVKAKPSGANIAFPSLQTGTGIPVSAYGEGVRTTDGTARARVGDTEPALVTKLRGKGMGVFLNFLPAAGPDCLRGLARDLLALAQVQPAVTVTDRTGTPVPVYFGQFQDAGGLYYGLVQRGKGGMVSEETSAPVTITWPRKQHVYDVRTGRYLGETCRVTADLTPSLAQVYACLPHARQALTLKPDRPGYRQGDIIHLTATTLSGAPERGLQVWRLRVFSAVDHEEPAYRRTFLVHAGKADLPLPIALDAPTGEWRVEARDAATGVTGTVTVRVTERKTE